MLGFRFHVYLSNDLEKRVLFEWVTKGVGGLTWLDVLIEKGEATPFVGNGYPVRSTSTLGVVLGAIFENRIQPSNGMWVVGDDYVYPPGKQKAPKVKNDVSGLPRTTPVTIDAWDLS